MGYIIFKEFEVSILQQEWNRSAGSGGGGS